MHVTSLNLSLMLLYIYTKHSMVNIKISPHFLDMPINFCILLLVQGKNTLGVEKENLWHPKYPVSGEISQMC